MKKNNYYYLKLFPTKEFTPLASYAYGINKNIKSLKDLNNHLIKAKKNNYNKIKIPFDQNSVKYLPFVKEEIEKNNLSLVTQLSFEHNTTLVKELLETYENLEIEILIENPSVTRMNSGFQKTISKHIKRCYLTLIVHKNIDIKELIQLGENITNLFFYFSPNYNENYFFLNCKQINKLLEKINFPVRRPPGNIIWDHRIPEDLELVPFYEAIINSNSPNPKIKYSFIIPTYNNREYVQATLTNLFNLKSSPNKFEILLIDDGSEDGTYERMIDFFSNYRDKYNFSYFYLPRFQKRVMGDARYRAGIARNFAIAHSIGEIFCFLDSDIIVPSTYLENVSDALEKHDLCQAVRLDLKKDSSMRTLKYQEINIDNNVCSRDQYWENFHKTTDDWNLIEDKWKYLCTHSLSMKRTKFLEFGSFEKNFIFYGFEDTDLGYKLSLKNFSFYLIKEPVFHLFHHNTRSEFFNSKYYRNILLSRTGQLFYLLHLDSQIFINFRDLMNPEFSWKRLLQTFLFRIKNKRLFKDPILKKIN